MSFDFVFKFLKFIETHASVRGTVVVGLLALIGGEWHLNQRIDDIEDRQKQFACMQAAQIQKIYAELAKLNNALIQQPTVQASTQFLPTITSDGETDLLCVQFKG